MDSSVEVNSLDKYFAYNGGDLCTTNIYILVKLTTVVESNPKVPFSIATTPRCWGGRISFFWIPHPTLDPYLIMLSVKQARIKHHF